MNVVPDFSREALAMRAMDTILASKSVMESLRSEAMAREISVFVILADICFTAADAMIERSKS